MRKYIILFLKSYDFFPPLDSALFFALWLSIIANLYFLKQWSSIHAWVRGLPSYLRLQCPQVRNFKSYSFYVPLTLATLIFSFSPCGSRFEIHFLPWSLISLCPAVSLFSFFLFFACSKQVALTVQYKQLCNYFVIGCTTYLSITLSMFLIIQTMHT